ncbi:hypothetical protein ACFV7R_40530 [Streptomyces sp. NPDC059866]|uniref:hypothetical protein n=1 Tax=Streptomyces sp. NPDC059866 TaxID=3346978 RepID=UPI003654C49E
MTCIRLADLDADKLMPITRGTTSWNARVTAIRKISPDILAPQEVIADESTTSRDSWERQAAVLIQNLAERCGLTSKVNVTDGHPYGTAMAANRHRPWWTALMWNPGTVHLVDGSYRPFGAPDFWHGCATARFDIGSREPILVAGYGAPVARVPVGEVLVVPQPVQPVSHPHRRRTARVARPRDLRSQRRTCSPQRGRRDNGHLDDCIGHWNDPNCASR